MKLSLIVILSAALCISPFAFAQQTEAPTSNTSPSDTASPAPKSSSENAQSSEPASGGRKYPTPGMSASAGESSSKSSTPSAAKTNPTTAPSAPVVLKGSSEQQIRQIEDAYETALAAHNPAMLEPFIADDSVITDSKNRVMNKRTVLAELKKDTDTYATAKNTEMKLHMVDKDVYLVTGVAREAGKDKSGQAFDRRYRFTDTFVNRNSKWLLVASHASLLSGR